MDQDGVIMALRDRMWNGPDSEEPDPIGYVGMVSEITI